MVTIVGQQGRRLSVVAAEAEGQVQASKILIEVERLANRHYDDFVQWAAAVGRLQQLRRDFEALRIERPDSNATWKSLQLRFLALRASIGRGAKHEPAPEPSQFGPISAVITGNSVVPVSVAPRNAPRSESVRVALGDDEDSHVTPFPALGDRAAFSARGRQGRVTPETAPAKPEAESAPTPLPETAVSPPAATEPPSPAPVAVSGTPSLTEAERLRLKCMLIEGIMAAADAAGREDKRAQVERLRRFWPQLGPVAEANEALEARFSEACAAYDRAVEAAAG